MRTKAKAVATWNNPPSLPSRTRTILSMVKRSCTKAITSYLWFTTSPPVAKCVQSHYGTCSGHRRQSNASVSFVSNVLCGYFNLSVVLFFSVDLTVCWYAVALFCFFSSLTFKLTLRIGRFGFQVTTWLYYILSVKDFYWKLVTYKLIKVYHHAGHLSALLWRSSLLACFKSVLKRRTMCGSPGFTSLMRRWSTVS